MKGLCVYPWVAWNSREGYASFEPEAILLLVCLSVLFYSCVYAKINCIFMNKINCLKLIFLAAIVV